MSLVGIPTAAELVHKSSSDHHAKDTELMSSSDSDSSSETNAAAREPLEGHSKSQNVWSVAYSPDDTWFASCSEDKTIRIWNSITGHQIGKSLKGHTGGIGCLDISPDGTRIVSGSDDKTVRVWDLTTREVVLGPLEDHTDHIWTVKYSPLGDLIASGSRDRSVRLWNADSGECVATLKHPHIVTGLAFSPSGIEVATTCADSCTRIWRLDERELVMKPLSGHVGWVWSVVYSADGRLLASGGRDCTIRIWNAHTGALKLGPLKGHTLPVRSICFTPDGQKLISASDDRSVRAWDLSKGTCFWGPLHANVSLWCSAISSNGLRIVLCGSKGKLFVRDVLSGKLVLPKGDEYKPSTGELMTTIYAVRALAWFPDGTQFASAGDDFLIRTWHTKRYKKDVDIVDPFVNHIERVESIDISRDGSTVVSGSADCTVCIWNTKSKKLAIPPIKRHTESVTAVLLVSDRNLLITASQDRTVCFWDTRDGRFIRVIEHENAVNAAVLSPDASMLASGSDGGTIQFWDINSGSESSSATRMSHDNDILCLCFSPDGSRILAGSRGTTVRVWNCADGELLLMVNHAYGVHCVQYAPDGRSFLIGESHGNHVSIRDAGSGEVIRSLEHDNHVLAASFSPDGTKIASGTEAGGIRVWEVASGKLLLGSGTKDHDEESDSDQEISRESRAHASLESFIIRPATLRRQGPSHDRGRHSSFARESSRQAQIRQSGTPSHAGGSRGIKYMLRRIIGKTDTTHQGDKRPSRLRRMVPVSVARAKERLAGVVDPREGEEAGTDSEEDESDENVSHSAVPGQSTIHGVSSSTDNISTCWCIPSKHK